MIKQELKLIITFRTTTQAMAMEKFCKEAGAPGRLIPVPKSITAGCGMAWAASPEAEDEIMGLMKEKDIKEEAIYKIMV